MMKLKREENVKVAIEVDKVQFIPTESAMLFQNTEGDNEMFFYIKDSASEKEIKIKIWKE